MFKITSTAVAYRRKEGHCCKAVLGASGQPVELQEKQHLLESVSVGCAVQAHTGRIQVTLEKDIAPVQPCFAKSPKAEGWAQGKHSRSWAEVAKRD